MFGGAPLGGGLGGGLAAVQTSQTAIDPNINTNQDYEVPGPVSEDGISCLALAANNSGGQPVNLLAAGGWDCGVKVWQLNVNIAPQPGNFGGQPQQQISAQPAMAFKCSGPVLSCDFNPDGTILFTGDCANNVTMFQLMTQKEQVIGKHDGPVKHVCWCQDMGMCISGSWDKTIRFWNGQTATAQCTLQLPERVYAMDVNYPVMVVGTAERKLLVYDLSNIQNNQRPIHEGATALKMQTRCLKVFPDKTGYAVGSIEGRCSIAYLNQNRIKDNFAFKCHRANDEIYAVNAIAFHPGHGTFATAGADGVYTIWDKDNRQRLKGFNSVKNPITATAFTKDGNWFVYAVSYDWSRGFENNRGDYPRKIFIHKVDESEVKPKPGAANNRGPGGRR